jgi:hypothetical protein
MHLNKKLVEFSEKIIPWLLSHGIKIIAILWYHNYNKIYL